MSMILPTKRLSESRSLLGMGAVILSELSKPKDLSRLWEDVKAFYSEGKDQFSGPQTFTYEWFVLALDFLYLIKAVTVQEGRIYKVKSSTQVAMSEGGFQQVNVSSYSDSSEYSLSK